MMNPNAVRHCGALLASLRLQAVVADPHQGSITLPGGFATACASQISTTSRLPGADLTAHFANHPGRPDACVHEFESPLELARFLARAPAGAQPVAPVSAGLR